MHLTRWLRSLCRAAQTLTERNARDDQLVERFASQHDEEAFTNLVECHGPMVLGVCKRVLRDEHGAEDAFQATFLILAQKARSIRQQVSITSWLCRVAYRVALAARLKQSRQRDKELQAMAMRPNEVASSDAARELRWLIDEELHRLPQKYQTPLVLCCLEAKTHEEAAELLGLPMGTVQSRLARGRDLLRSRLSRRGVAIPAAFFATALAEAVTPETASAALRAVAVRTAILFPTAGAIAPPVLTLAEGVLKTMLLKKLIMVTLVAFGTIVLGGSVVGFWLSGKSDAQTTVAPFPKEKKPIVNASQVAKPVEKDGRKDEPKDEPAGTVVSLTPGMSIRLLPGYTHQKKRGKDSVVGEIVKKDGLTISYDIGKFGPVTLGNALWQKEQTLPGKKVKIVFSKQKELLLVVNPGEKSYASFYTKVKSEEDVTEALLLVLSVTQEKK